MKKRIKREKRFGKKTSVKQIVAKKFEYWLRTVHYYIFCIFLNIISLNVNSWFIIILNESYNRKTRIFQLVIIIFAKVKTRICPFTNLIN